MTFEQVLQEELGLVELDARIDEAPVDSLDYLCFLKRIEEEFKLHLPDDLSGLETFRALEEFVEEHGAHA